MVEASQETGALTAPAGPADGARWPAELRMRIAIVLTGAVTPLLDAAIMHVALRSLALGLGVPLSTAQWTVTAYLLAFAAAVPTSTWAVQRFGAERAYLAALGTFTAASALCGMAGSAWELVLARVLQGAGGGLIGSVGRTMLVTAAGPRRLPRVMAVYEVPVMLVIVAGPLIGGELLRYAGWRAIFLVNVPIGVAGMAFARRLLSPRPTGPRRALDVVGLLLISPGLAGVTYGVSEAGQAGSFTSPAVAVPLGCGLALIAAFALWSLRDRRPLMDLRLYRNAVFRAAAQATLATGAAVLGGSLLLPLYLQTVRGEDVWRTGLLIAPQGLGVAVATGLSGRIFERIGSGTVLAGSGILTTATVPFAFLTPTTPYGWLVAAAVARGIGIGLTLTPAMTAAFQRLAPVQISEASAQFQALQHIGGSLGTATLILVLTRVSPVLRHDPGSGAHAFDLAYRALIGISGASLAAAVALVAARRRYGETVPAAD